MLKELTPEQLVIMEETREEWLGYIFKPKPITKETIEKIVAGVKWLYGFCGLAEPQVIVVDSPHAAQLLANRVDSSPKESFTDEELQALATEIFHEIQAEYAL